MGPSLSQVLLTNDYWCNRLVASVPTSTFGVELGPGRGALTEGLSDHWKYMVALELDREFSQELRDRFDPANVGVVRTNLLEYPFPDRSSSYPVVGNLPYHITGPTLLKIGRNHGRISGFYGLVQREVAERISANTGDSEYRSISLLMQWFFEVEWAETIPPSAFRPEPEVESGWIKLIPRDGEWSFEAVRQFTEVCFQQPRKTLLNNLSAHDNNKSAWKTWFQNQGWDPRRRPHSLAREEFMEVFDAWSNRF